MSDYRMIEMDIVRAADQRGIVATGSALEQAAQVLSAANDLHSATKKANRPAQQSAIGDMLRAVIVLAAINDFDVVKCLEKTK